MKTIKYISTLALMLAFAACSQKKPEPKTADTVTNSSRQTVELPAPYQTKSSTVYCKVIGWAAGQLPVAPAGFKVNLFAQGLDNPRLIYVAKNGGVFVSEANTELKWLKRLGASIIGASKSQNLNKSANKVILLQDKDGDGVAETKTVFLSGLNQPFGMLVMNGWFYVANTDGLWRYPYKAGENHVSGKGQMILSLPAGGYNNHWTRNLCANRDSSKIFISVGSGSNDADHGILNEVRRADILEINPDGTGERIYASGLRNPAGIALQPETKALWAAVNERDTFGDNLVPDYLTSVKEGGFYGWPYAYFGPHPDPLQKGARMDIVRKTITPDFALGTHTASLGLAFYDAKSFGQKYRNGAFIGQHGSWNSSKLVGYKVTFIPFLNGRPSGPMEDFLTGFVVDIEKKEVHGRPVGIAVAGDGSLLVADDSGNKIWRVKPL